MASPAVLGGITDVWGGTGCPARPSFPAFVQSADAFGSTASMTLAR